MPCVALTCNIKRVLNQVPRVVLKKVVKEIHEMICSSWRIIDNFVPLIDRKTDSDWLVDTEQMTEVIPAP